MISLSIVRVRQGENCRTSIPTKLLQHHAVDGFDDGISEADCYYDDDYVNKMGGDHYSDK